MTFNLIDFKGSWSADVNYANPSYGKQPLNMPGTLNFAAPAVMYQNILYIANGSVSPTKGTLPPSDSAWTAASTSVVGGKSYFMAQHKTTVTTTVTTTPAAINFTTAMDVTKSSDITITSNTTINLPAGNKYAVNLSVIADTFSTLGDLARAFLTVNSVTSKYQAISNALSITPATFGTQGSTMVILDFTTAATPITLNLDILGIGTANVSGNLSGNQLAVSIYSL